MAGPDETRSTSDSHPDAGARIDIEGLGVFYLGRKVDPETGRAGREPLMVDARRFTTHCVCVGMTGSGKTGLLIDLIEEAALDGIPTLVIDPKGDLANVLLPSANGVFLASWLVDSQQLLIKTFVDRSHLLPSQLQAVQEIARIGEGQVGAHILDAMAPGWLNLTRQDINQRLFDAWRHYGWRFDTERLHPGLSDPAWLVH